MVVAPPVVPTATSPLLLLHVPAAVVELNDVVNPTHTESIPVIAFGFGLTVTIVVARQPVASSYVTVDVPAILAVTMVVAPPVVPAVTSPLLLLHVPAAVVELNEVVKPTHTASTPVIAFGFGFTVTASVTKQPSLKV